MQAVERGKAGNRRLGQVRELADVGLFSAVLEDHCELIQLLHGYVVATKSVCELAVGKIAEVLDDHATRGRRPALSLSSYEYRVFFFLLLFKGRGEVKKS